ncbi:MAG: phosphatidylglycerophosphatase A [Candidatus Omnitrophica bacterium]|nr:phosphatidylglycerophosphatase A [Candidatus Omnitrophota bacterium]
MQKLIKLISTCFYTGYSPVVPGTLGSLAGLLLYVLIGKDFMFYTGVSIFLLIVGFLISGRAENIFGIKDDRRIVIDEVCGMMLSLLFIPYKRLYYLMGFLLFRLFDICKPYPARKLEKMSGSAGIMLDDIAAALYTNLVLRIIT